jgi:hypothetical protein
LIYSKMKRSIENPTGLQLGASKSDGAPLIYDPKDNVLIVRDPRGADCGTVFKPDLQEKPNYVRDKFGWNEPSFKPGQLAAGSLTAPAEPRPVPPSPAGEPSAPKPPIEAPTVKPTPRMGEGGGRMPGLPLGGGLPADAPATGPHVIHPHKPGQHHRMPLLGELPDDYGD